MFVPVILQKKNCLLDLVFVFECISYFDYVFVCTFCIVSLCVACLLCDVFVFVCISLYCVFVFVLAIDNGDRQR